MELLFSIEEPEPGFRLQRLYDRVAARFGFDPARVRLSRRKLTGGHIEYGPPHRITISAHLSEAEQRDTLLDLGCAYGQGYLLGRPLTADECVAALRAG